jgi:hypothetical protein
VQGIRGWDAFPIGVCPKRRAVVVEVGHLQKRKPFDGESLRENLRDRLAAAVPEVDWSLGRNTHYPDVPLAVLASGDALDRFLGVIDWVIARVRAVRGVA